MHTIPFYVIFVTLILDLKAGDANTVFQCLMKVLLNDFDVPIDRIIGICSDGAATMQGVHKGVCTQLARYIREMRAATIVDIRARSINGRDLDSFHEGRGVFAVHALCVPPLSVGIDGCNQRHGGIVIK